VSRLVDCLQCLVITTMHYRICKDTSSGREDWRKILKLAMYNDWCLKCSLRTDHLYSSHACIYSEGWLLLVETLSRGVDLYELPGSSPSCTFSGPSKHQCTKDVGFAEGAAVIVSRSDDGTIYVFSIDGPEPIQTLKQGGVKSLIQAIDVGDISITLLTMLAHSMQTTTIHGFHYIIASATSDDKSELSLWCKHVSASNLLNCYCRHLNVSNRCRSQCLVQMFNSIDLFHL